MLLKDFFVLIIKDIGIDFCADLCQPLPLADVLTVIGRKVLRYLVHIGGILNYISVSENVGIVVPEIGLPVTKRTVELLLIYIHVKILHKSTDSIDDFFLKLRCRDGFAGVITLEQKSIILSKRRFCNIVIWPTLLHIVRHGCQDLFPIVVEPHIPVFRTADRVHPPGFRENGDIGTLTKQFIFFFICHNYRSRCSIHLSRPA